MTTPGTSRRRRRPAAAVGWWTVGPAVLATLMALIAAGLVGTPARSGARAGAVAVDRTFGCPGGLPGTTATGGRAGSGGGQSGAVGASPRLVRVDAAHASRGYAVQEARPGGGLAVTPCPEPRSQWWFTGLGAARPHTSRVVLANPRDADALVDVEVLGPDGPVDLPDLRGLEVRHGGSRVLDLAKLAPVRGEVAVHVTATRGLVSAVAADSFATGLLGVPMQEWVPGTDRLSRHRVLTGLPDRPEEATLLLANPARTEVLVTLRGVGRTGSFTLPGHEEVRVPPGGVASVDVAKAFDGHPTALSVEAERPVVATVRTLAHGDIAYAGAGPALHRASALGVPSGARAQVRVSSTRGATQVRVTGYDGRGRASGSHTVRVDAGTTAGLQLDRRTRSVVVEPGEVPVVAGLLLETGSGVAGATFPPAANASRAPVVRPE